MTVFVRGLDNTDERVNVEKALTERMQGIAKNELSVRELRPMWGCMQACTIRIKERWGNILLKNPNIKIGWAVCRVERRVNLRKCLRCWEMGHVIAECKGEERKGCCYRCGKKGHKKKTCEAKEWCVLCELEGHMTETGRCG
ncbi:uncharacterized protein [Euwallacea fornicatus]|uniref:uncharacterized protein n=1 Tax=Euwallacea fornicatus TaxID=995702 RepID=UPI00338EF2AE